MAVRSYGVSLQIPEQLSMSTLGMESMNERRNIRRTLRRVVGIRVWLNARTQDHLSLIHDRLSCCSRWMSPFWVTRVLHPMTISV